MYVKLLALLLFLPIFACKPSIKKQAKSAAKDFCGCVKDNIFSYRNGQEIFNLCNRKIQTKYWLFKLYIDAIDNDNLRNSYSPRTKDSIQEFMTLFRHYSDSCQSLPKTEAKCLL
jgi:hypothetical protein